MRNLGLAVVFSAFIIAAPAFAANVDLEKEHGAQLNKAPYAMRFKFNKDTGVVWSKSTYDQRQQFLESWYDGLEQDAKTARDRDKALKSAEKEQLNAKKQAMKIQKDRKKKELDKIKQEQREEELKKKEFNEAVREQQRRIKAMRQMQKSRGRQ